MRATTRKALADILSKYNAVMEVMERDARKANEDEERAYGGFVRMAKGQIQEYITDQIIRAAWGQELRQPIDRLDINSKKISIPIQIAYINSIPDHEIREHLRANLVAYKYGLSVDKHVFIDRNFVVAIECKAYTENAMLKRILVDFMLLKTKYPSLDCFLFQLESQLGGDYSALPVKAFGSKPTHTIMSYFQNVCLNVVTLLPGERKVDRPINKPQFSKELSIDRLEYATEKIVSALTDHVAQ